jgi:hypothetical protein
VKPPVFPPFPTTEHQTCSCGARKSPPLPPCSTCGKADSGVTFAPTDPYSLYPICVPCALVAWGLGS